MDSSSPAKRQKKNLSVSFGALPVLPPRPKKQFVFGTRRHEQLETWLRKRDEAERNAQKDPTAAKDATTKKKKKLLTEKKLRKKWGGRLVSTGYAGARRTSARRSEVDDVTVSSSDDDDGGEDTPLDEHKDEEEALMDEGEDVTDTKATVPTVVKAASFGSGPTVSSKQSPTTSKLGANKASSFSGTRGTGFRSTRGHSSYKKPSSASGQRPEIGDDEDGTGSESASARAPAPARRGLSSLRGRPKLKAHDSVYGNYGRGALRGYSGKVQTRATSLAMRKPKREQLWDSDEESDGSDDVLSDEDLSLSSDDDKFNDI